MNSIDISLVMPSKLGGRVVSRQSVQQAISENPGLQAKSVGSGELKEEGFQDFGASLLVLAGTAAGAAAVKGIFDVIKTVIQEAYRARRERFASEAQMQKIQLLLAHKTTEFDLDRPLEELERQLEEKQAEVVKELGTNE